MMWDGKSWLCTGWPLHDEWLKTCWLASLSWASCAQRGHWCPNWYHAKLNARLSAVGCSLQDDTNYSWQNQMQGLREAMNRMRGCDIMITLKYWAWVWNTFRADIPFLDPLSPEKSFKTMYHRCRRCYCAWKAPGRVGSMTKSLLIYHLLNKLPKMAFIIKPKERCW
jgi:hypothetical protein